MTGVTHPRYTDGTPILLGDTVRYVGEGNPPETWGSMVVVHVRWSGLTEAWIYTDVGNRIVFTADALERLRGERHLAQPGRCTSPYQSAEGGQVHECNRRINHDGPDCRCRCGASWPGGGR